MRAVLHVVLHDPHNPSEATPTPAGEVFITLVLTTTRPTCVSRFASRSWSSNGHYSPTTPNCSDLAYTVRGFRQYQRSGDGENGR